MELRYLLRTEEVPGSPGFARRVQVLQSRTMIMSRKTLNSGMVEEIHDYWSEWEDVPTVEEL